MTATIGKDLQCVSGRMIANFFLLCFYSDKHTHRNISFPYHDPTCFVYISESTIIQEMLSTYESPEQGGGGGVYVR